MTTLVMTLAGPLQSWGASSRFGTRGTEAAPTKSGVLGLLAAADGRRRTDPVEDLLTLRFGVRADQPGRLLQDYHTARPIDSRGKPMDAVLSRRHYLADAIFVACVQGDTRLVDSLAEALRNPHYAPFLGRRSCPPSQPVFTAVRDADLMTALANESWKASPWVRQREQSQVVRLEVWRDAAGNETSAQRQQDIPISYDPERRQFGERRVVREFVTVSTGNELPKFIGHDPIALLQEG